LAACRLREWCAEAGSCWCSRGDVNNTEIDLVEAIDELKSAMYDEVRLRQSQYDPDKYRVIRRAILEHPEARTHVPEWLRRGASVREAVSLIRSEAGEEAGKWQRRDEIVSRGLNPLLELLEGADLTTAHNFDIGDLLGRGGFGEVYRCRHKLLDLDFAIKLLNPSVFVDDKDHALERFFREAKILFSLRHPHIVRVFDVGMMGRRPFIRMELIEGSSLRERIRDNGGLTVADARRVVARLSAALAHAHDRGIIHRDLKPHNVIITGDDWPVLLDFGLGVLVEDELVSRLTRSGEAAAGGVYAAPELLRDPKLLDPKTDVYSLGVMWFEMLTGSTPSGAGLMETLEQLPDVASDERELLMACLGSNSRRPTSRELRDGMKAFVKRWERIA